MTSRGWGIRSGAASLILVFSIVSLSPTVLANPISNNPFWGLIFLVPVNLPINTLVLMLIYVLFASFVGPPKRLGRGRFFELFFYSTLIITFTGALIDGLLIAFEIFALIPVCAFLVGLIVYWVCSSILGMSENWSIIAAVNFFAINLLVWVGMILYISSNVFDAWFIFVSLYVALVPLMWVIARKYHSLDRYAEVTTVDSRAMGYSYWVDPRQDALDMTDGTIVFCRLVSFALIVILIIVSLPI
ncbi:MAG: hypothetical protein KAJ35_01315 [Thermoplasmata archaeon]|nr:hypothetical protein [Thermoplasmata archaeon]